MAICKNCKTEIEDSVINCSICKYPIQGTKQEKGAFIAKQIIQKGDVKESLEKLKNSRMVLFGLGAFYIIVPFIPFFGITSSFALIFSIVLGSMFIGFGFLTYKKPLIALGIPLLLTILYYLVLLLIDPMLLWSGILWKMVVVLGLGYGFFSVKKSNKILKENEYLASVLGFSQISNK